MSITSNVIRVANKHHVIYDTENVGLFILYGVKINEKPNYKLAVFAKGKLAGRNISRELMGVTDRNIHVDHINGNTLDVRRSNLRLVSNQQNSFNSVAKGSLPKGVSSHGKGYRARITYNGVEIHLGTYETTEEAEAKYKLAADRYFGKFALHNSRDEK